jgi:hypothetical protein
VSELLQVSYKYRNGPSIDRALLGRTKIVSGDLYNMKKKLIAAALAAALGTLGLNAHADTDNLADIFTTGHVDGDVRAYDFSRLYDFPAKLDQRAFSLAALINAQTGSFHGFSIGVSLVAANSLGSQSNNEASIDASLMGPHSSVNALSQAYLQYKNDMLLFRGGYQYLDTPWMGNNDSRVIPSSYNAILAGVTPVTGWNIYGIRVFDWKSRTSDGMYPDNLYYPETYDGDNIYGNNGSLPASAPKAPGTDAFGTSYVNGGLKVQGWYYDFLDFADSGYAEGSYVFKTGTGFDPVIGAQLMRQSGSTGNILVDTQTTLFGVVGDDVKSRAWGADLGLVIPHGRFDLFYNEAAQQAGAVGDGAIVSPYTTNYGTDPLYTTSMIRGLVEAGPGHAWKAKALYNLFDDKLQLVGAYAKYITDTRGDSHDLYVDINYKPTGWVKGLTLRDRWERSDGGANALNPGNEAFVYNRVMIDYRF